VAEKREAFYTACKFSRKPIIDRIAKLETEPSRQYVDDFLKDHGISLSSPSAITSAREEAGTVSNIKHWFTAVFTFELFCSTAPMLFFNADELHLDFDMGGKVCKKVGPHRSPAVATEESVGHITMMMTISLNFFPVPLFYILGGLKAVPPEYATLYAPGQACFTANDSGWMTRATFLLWVRMFTDGGTANRQIGNFNPALPLILFLDGHISRDCAPAMELLAKNNIIAITFPGQLTHVLQPVDVCIGAPFRHAYRRLLRLRKLRWKSTAAPGQKLTAGEKRQMIVGASLDATQQATIKTNRESAFSTTGLCPYNPNSPCQGPYVKHDEQAPIHPDGRTVKRDTISAKVLTSPLVLPTLTK
jgi:hypothetical protein